MYIELFQYGLWTLTAILQITASVYILKQGLRRKFPVFFSYAVFQVLSSTALFIVLQCLKHRIASYVFYFKFYWIINAVGAGLYLFLVFEISRNFLSDYPLARRIVSVCLSIGAVALLVFAIVLVQNAPGNEPHQLISMILLVDRSLAIVQVGLVLIIFACAKLMAIPWRTNLPFGISLGVGLIGTVNMTASFIRSQYGADANVLYHWAKIFAYLFAALIWVVYIFPSRQTTFSADMNAVSGKAHDWNAALTELVHE